MFLILPFVCKTFTSETRIDTPFQFPKNQPYSCWMLYTLWKGTWFDFLFVEFRRLWVSDKQTNFTIYRYAAARHAIQRHRTRWIITRKPSSNFHSFHLLDWYSQTDAVVRNLFHCIRCQIVMILGVKYNENKVISFLLFPYFTHLFGSFHFVALCKSSQKLPMSLSSLVVFYITANNLYKFYSKNNIKSLTLWR